VSFPFNFWGRRGRALLVGLLVFGAMAGLSFTNPGRNAENFALDICYSLRPPSPPPPELLIVGIDEISFKEFQRPWPWPRYFHATLVRELSAAGARLILFDVLFADPGNPDEDRAFAEAMKQAGNVILASNIEKSESPGISRLTLVEPGELFRQVAFDAPFVVTPDADGVVRRFRLSLGGLDTVPALVAQILGPERKMPPDLTGLINYIGPPGSIETISYYQILDPERLPPPAKIRNRIVLIGRTLESSIDALARANAFFTPFFSGPRQSMSGVEMQGHILYTVLKGTWGRELPRRALFAVYFLLMVAFSFGVIRLSPQSGLMVLLGFMVLLAFASISLFLGKNFWMPPMLAMLGLSTIYSTHALIHLATEVREKRWLRQALSRYVSPAVVEIIAEHPGILELGGEEVDATILFADLADFTALTEKMPPKEVIHLLDECFTVMTRIILSHQGTVDKYIGDAIMCFWGAPLPQPDHATRACRAALDMQKTMHSLEELWQALGKKPLTLRIGLHSGRVVAGNVGSRERFNYTVVGDAVNLAHRLENINKYYGSKILLSGATQALVTENFLTRELDRVMVKGRTQPVTIYELLEYLPPEGVFPPELSLFAAGLAAYRAQQWALAEEKFRAVLRLNSHDAPAKLYLRRVSHFLKDPPPPTWQDIHILETIF